MLAGEDDWWEKPLYRKNRRREEEKRRLRSEIPSRINGFTNYKTPGRPRSKGEKITSIECSICGKPGVAEAIFLQIEGWLKSSRSNDSDTIFRDKGWPVQSQASCPLRAVRNIYGSLSIFCKAHDEMSSRALSLINGIALTL